ncbi:MAG: hypothetical protein Q7S72_00615 [Candidatus Taylorbacteria bacterium]|nr:hypothetical protein [Candidatus Taylorbacteria bacterium]
MKYINFKNLINKPFFRKSDLDYKSAGLAKIQLSRWLKMGYIHRIKRSFYIFADSEDLLDPRTISFFLYEPSYISLESALSYYGFIPEMVPVTTCLSTRTTRTFINRYGKFMYRHITPDLFWGYVIIDTIAGKYLLAEPEKALLDYVYFNQKRLRNADDIHELRINEFEFKKVISIPKLKKYLAYYNSPHMSYVVNLILDHVNTRSN